MPNTSDWLTGQRLKLDLLLETVHRNKYIPDEPTEKQADFLTTPEREVMYGGAGGGGKSSALLMAALQYVSIPGYAAILFRRTYADLARSGALMDRAGDWLADTGARWNSSAHRWTFPSRATLEFGYLDTEHDRDNYRSAEFQFCGFDELTTFREGDYRFLFSRLRRLKESYIPVRMRAGTNPGGPGHDWCKQRFIVADDTPNRRFIPAKLADNPYIDANEYRTSLAELDAVTRAQIEEGDWEAFQGGRFRAEWFAKTYGRRGSHWCFPQATYEDGMVSIYQTVDHAATVQKSLKDDPDWTVISTWGVTPRREWLWVDCVRFRAEVPEVLEKLKQEYQRWRPDYVMIEGGGTQKGLAQFARRAGLPVREYAPGKDKLQRAMPAIVLCEQGKLWLPDVAPWKEQALGELLRFTGDPKRDSHDDVTDCLSMAAECYNGFVLKSETFAPRVVGGVRR
jgi:predicted phage terminase large subunit-like protein